MNKTLLSKNDLHVFIADDDTEDLEIFSTVVKGMSSEVKITMSMNGIEFLKQLETGIPDIVFLDINMPLMNGIEGLTEMRKHARYATVPVIMYSTTAEDKIANLTYSLGANIYIQKPLTYTTIHDSLHKVLSLTYADFFPQPPYNNFVWKVNNN